MSQRTFSLIAGVVFGLIALGHVLRIVFGLSLTVQDFSVPMWASGLAVVILGYLAYEGLRLASDDFDWVEVGGLPVVKNSLLRSMSVRPDERTNSVDDYTSWSGQLVWIIRFYCLGKVFCCHINKVGKGWKIDLLHPYTEQLVAYYRSKVSASSLYHLSQGSIH